MQLNHWSILSSNISNDQNMLVKFLLVNFRCLSLFIRFDFESRCNSDQFFDANDPVPKCSMNKTFFGFQSVIFKLIFKFNLKEIRKGFSAKCSNLPNECDSSLGLSCQNKICTYVLYLSLIYLGICIKFSINLLDVASTSSLTHPTLSPNAVISQLFFFYLGKNIKKLNFNLNSKGKKKSNAIKCSDILGECDTLKGLSCQDKNGVKYCLYFNFFFSILSLPIVIIS